jgi:hypothetical protein
LIVERCRVDGFGLLPGTRRLLAAAAAAGSGLAAATGGFLGAVAAGHQALALAELQTRVDRKYFVPAETFRRLIGELAGELQVLEIGGLHSFGYESVYFDTPQLSAPAAAPAAVQGPHPHLHRQRADHVRGQAGRGPW